MEKTIVTYHMYDHMMDKLVERIEFSKLYTKVKYVFAPPRGGLPIAVHLAHHLGLTFLDRTDLNNLPKRELKKVLMVDDIADTGRTLVELKYIFVVKFITATLFLKDRSEIEPDFWIEKDNNWIVFPWEKLDETPNREGYDD